MNRKLIKMFRKKRKKGSVKKLLLALLGVNIAIFIISYIIIYFSNWIIIQRINQIVIFQVEASRVLVQATQSFNQATYTALIEIENGNYDKAYEVFTDKIKKSIDYIEDYLKNKKYVKQDGLENLNKMLFDFKVYLNNYKRIFIDYVEKKKKVNNSRAIINILINSLSEQIIGLKSDLSKKVLEQNVSKDLKSFYQQALTDTILLSYEIKKFKIDLLKHIDNVSNGIDDNYEIRHYISKQRFMINSIFLNAGRFNNKQRIMMNLLKNIEKNSLEAELLAEKISIASKDSSFYYRVIESMEYGFNKEINMKINKLKYRLLVLRDKLLFLIVAVVGISIMFLLLFIFIVKNRIFYPFSVFLNAIKSASKGKRDILIELDTNDEFNMLAEYFNKMSNAILEREDELIHEKELVELKSRELESLKRYIEDIIHASPNAIFTVDNNLKIIFLNKKAIELSGEKNLAGKKLTDIKCVINEYVEDILDVLSKEREKVLSKRRVVFPNYDKKIINLYIYPLHTTDGVGAVIEMEDVTEKVFIEEKMHESQKMETVGLLAGGFAHDFNNLLTGLMGYIELATMTKDHSKIMEYLKRVKDISIHASKLVQQILLFSQTGPGKKEFVDVGVILEGAISMIKFPIKKNVKLIKDVERDLKIYADASQLTQAILNLIINSFEAVNEVEDGYLKIKARKLKSIDEMEDTKVVLDNDKNYIEIVIEDNGIGMSKEVKSKIFEPFFTTKTRGNIKGTGLGLSIVYRVIKNHNGEIVVSSTESKGTKFKIYLPIEKDEGVISKSAFIDKDASKPGRILLVDDEDMVREVGKEILESLGHKVIVLRNGKECIDFFKKEKEDIDLIIMDLIMPEMNGPETLKELSKLKINIPVLIASGYITLDMNYLKDYDYVKGMIRKPYSVEDISIKLAKILGGK